MLILVYGITDTIDLDEQKALRDGVERNVAEILNLTESIKPIFIEIVPCRFPNSAGLFAQIHLDKQEQEAQSKIDRIKKAVCATLKNFAITKIQSSWMIGVSSSIEDFYLSEIEL